MGAGGKEGNIRILTLGGGPSVCLKTPAKTGLGERFHRVALPSPADAGTSPYFRSIPRGNTTPGCLAADAKSIHSTVPFVVCEAPTRSKPSPRPRAIALTLSCIIKNCLILLLSGRRQKGVVLGPLHRYMGTPQSTKYYRRGFLCPRAIVMSVSTGKLC